MNAVMVVEDEQLIAIDFAGLQRGDAAGDALVQSPQIFMLVPQRLARCKSLSGVRAYPPAA